MADQYEPYLGPIVTRPFARSLGLKHYFLGTPCHKGHVSQRFVSTCWCYECARQRHQATKGVTHVRTVREKKCTDAELAYAAGFFDGEGHIGIAYHKARPDASSKNKYARYTLFCAATQTRREVIDWFADKFGGTNTFGRHRRSYDHRFYERFGWAVATAAAGDFLALVRPWLIVKAAEADVAIAFQSTMNRHTGRLPTPDSVTEFRAECFRKIRDIRKSDAIDQSRTEALDAGGEPRPSLR